jgi:hypothetical protein
MFFFFWLRLDSKGLDEKSVDVERPSRLTVERYLGWVGFGLGTAAADAGCALDGFASHATCDMCVTT